MLLVNIQLLVGVEPSRENLREWVAGAEMDHLGMIENAYLLMDGQKIVDYGPMEQLPAEYAKMERLDLKGQIVMPAFCDSHTHIVYAGSREGEFIDKIKGMSYEQIARRGGGILNSSDRLRETSEDELYAQALARVNEMVAQGTGAAEIKSGYGLSLESELKMLRVIKRLKETTPLTIKATLLAAHAVGREFAGRQDEYVDMIIRDIIPAVGREKLADFVDVFCDKGFFTVEQTDRMLKAGAEWGMVPKIHANELAESGGIEIGVANNALSVDHLEFTGPAQIECLKNSRTMATLLPGAAFFLEMEYPPVRNMISAGLPVALASDYNPGSSPSASMKFVLSLACIKMKMTPAEAINAATLNSAYAMGLSSTHGSIGIGKRANIVVLKPISSLEFLPYAYTADLVDKVILGGKIVKS